MSGPDPRRPPAWLSRAIALTLAASARPAVLGDLEERYTRRAERSGVRAALVWYTRQAIAFWIRVPVAALGRAVAETDAGARNLTMSIVRDSAYALRNLRARPGYTLPVIAVLALAIAASTLVFSLLDAVVLRELPYPDPDSLVLLWDRNPEFPARDVPIRPDHYDRWRERTDLFSFTGAFETAYGVVRWEDGTERTNGLYVTPGLLETLGARPALGRLLTGRDAEEGAPLVNVLSHRTWSTRFGSDPGVLGQEIVIDGQDVRVIGVLPEDFWFYDPYMFRRSTGARENAEAAFWMPFNAYRHAADQQDYRSLRVVARLLPGISLDTASERVAAQRLAMAEPDAERTAELVPLREQMVGSFEDDLGLLGLAVAMVLVIACSNVVSLLLFRSAGRKRELWMRTALGARRRDLAGILLAESCWLGAAGGVAGILLASPAIDLVIAMTPRELPMVHRAGLDTRVVLVILALALGCGFVTGAVQTARALRQEHRPRRGGTRATDGNGSVRLAFTALQVAVSIGLLVGAASTVRTFVGLRTAAPGFDATNTLTFQTSLWTAPGGEPADPTFLLELLERVEALPRVESVAGASVMPLSGWGQPRGVRLPAGGEDSEPIMMEFRYVTAGFFDTLQIRLSAGRVFDDRDVEGALGVAILNRAAARQLLGSESPIGASVETRAGDRPPVSHDVVGVVADTLQFAVGEAPRPTIYVPMLQEPVFGLHFAVRTDGDSLELIPAIRDAANELDPRHPISNFGDLEQLLVSTIGQQRFFARLIGAFGVLALALACSGVYGVVSHAARVRMPEMGVRKAFGAHRAHLHRLMLGYGSRPIAAGILIGVPAALGIDRLLASVVPHLVRSGPLIVAAVVGTFCLSALAAAAIPARRAGAVDAVRALRERA